MHCAAAAPLLFPGTNARHGLTAGNRDRPRSAPRPRSGNTRDLLCGATGLRGEYLGARAHVLHHLK
eukprot:1989446-Pyramimonas_sp.AAC.1